MQPKKLSVGFVTFPYGGNGASATEHPDVRNWLIRAMFAAKKDPRISEVAWEDFNDTPIPMTRNAAMEWAKDHGIDVLVMVDSDQACDLYLGKSVTAKPFFESSFDWIYQHYEKGPCIVYAPYVGHPLRPDGWGGENVFAFLWRNRGSADPTVGVELAAFTREEAAVRTGIEEVAAGATGCMMIDMRIGDTMQVPYFDYEYEGDGGRCQHCGEVKRGKRTKKITTEDVYFTRNASLLGCIKLGYNPLFINWDAWAGHWKPQCVGKPVMISTDAVAQELGQAYVNGIRAGELRRWVGPHVMPNGAALPVEELAKLSGTGQPAPASNGHAPSNGHVPVNRIANLNGKPSHYDFSEAHNTDPTDIEHLRKFVGSEAAIKGVRNERLDIVELGSWVGHSALAMAEACDGVADYTIHCVDHWEGGNAIQRKAAKEGDAYAEFCRNVGDRLDRTIYPLRGTTNESAEQFADATIDILFIDADHSYEGVLADIDAWLPKVKPGGLILGHDYSCIFPGVKRAVHERFGYDVATLGTVWAVRLDHRGKPQMPELKPAETKQVLEVS